MVFPDATSQQLTGFTTFQKTYLSPSRYLRIILKSYE
jgi:hypothetical protein